MAEWRVTIQRSSQLRQVVRHNSTTGEYRKPGIEPVYMSKWKRKHFPLYQEVKVTFCFLLLFYVQFQKLNKFLDIELSITIGIHYKKDAEVILVELCFKSEFPLLIQIKFQNLVKNLQELEIKF